MASPSPRHPGPATQSMVDEPDDRQLLARFARDGEQEPFARLVRRHVRFVYGCALRQTRDAATAEDVTQTVFTLLARQAGRITDGRVSPRGSLRGWLFAVARYAAANERRAAARRRRHERAAARPEAWRPDGGASAAEVAEVVEQLDRALARLSEADREAVLLHYLEGADARAVAAALGVSEQAARRRLSRAVKRMRRYFAAAGVTATPAAVSAALASSPEVPPDLVETVVRAATSPSAARLEVVRALTHAMALRAVAATVAVLLAGVVAVGGAGMLVKAAARALGGSGAAAVAPPTEPRRPVLRLTIAWNNQGVFLPMPATFPEELRHTDDYRRWESSGGARTFTWVTRDGRTYRCRAEEREAAGGRRVASIALVQRYRADGTLETETLCDEQGAPRQWTVFAADGKTKLASYTNCPPGTPGGPFVQSVRVYDRGGAAGREYHADRNGTVYAEWLLDERGQRVRLLSPAG